jgi:hypothetical protein
VERGFATVARRLGSAAACAVLLAGSTACTAGHRASPRPSRSPSPVPAQSTGAAPTLSPRPAPLRVRVTRVHGTMSPHARTVLAHRAGRTVAAYFDSAFLGQYPRTDFHAAFASFSPGAAGMARHDRALLTNVGLGPDTAAVVPRRRVAFLSVLAPGRVPVGITANVNLQMLVDHTRAPDQLVTVRGRLLLIRRRSGGWQIFGYDLSRSAVAARGAH